MNNTLLPCPFCGGEAELNHNYSDDYGDSYWVSCNFCGVATDSDWSQKTAIAAWNRRADHIRDTTKKVSNADRIRAMSDEELATEITKNPSIPCRMCEYYNHKLGYCDAQRDFVCVTAYAEALTLNWLRQPAKEEHNEAD